MEVTSIDSYEEFPKFWMIAFISFLCGRITNKHTL